MARVFVKDGFVKVSSKEHFIKNIYPTVINMRTVLTFMKNLIGAVSQKEQLKFFY